MSSRYSSIRREGPGVLAGLTSASKMMSERKTSEAEDSSAVHAMEESSRRQTLVKEFTTEHRLICRVCTKNFAQYTCPRCNVRYCSVQCYKGHSVRCTEQFAQENVLEEMKDMNATPESKQKMLEALKRIHFDNEGRSVFEDEYLQDLNEEEDGELLSGLDTDEVLSEKNLQKLAEGGEILLEDLSVSEMKAFQRAIAGGKFSHMIKPWEPWWAHPLAHTISLSKDGTPLVQPLEEVANRGALPMNLELVSQLDSETGVESSEIPAPPDKPLQAIKDLAPKPPSPLLGVHLIEAVYGYCFMLRLFNGDWESDPLDAALVLLDVARILGDGASPESVGGALAECLETICSPALKHAGGYRFGVGLLDDTSLLLGLRREGLLCALADMHRNLGSAQIELQMETKALREKHSTSSQKRVAPLRQPDRNVDVTSKRKSSTKVHRSQSRRLQLAQKKVYFMMCWVNEQPKEAYDVLVSSVQKEKSLLIVCDSSNSSNYETIVFNNEKIVKEGQGPTATSKKLLIQEVG